MTPWLHRCPQGHASIEPRQDGTYRCGTCEAKYRVGPFDARETEFPVDDIEPIETPNETDVLAALDAATNSRPSAAARQLATPVKATTQRLIGLRERGLVETVDVVGKAARWRLTAAGRREVDGQVDPNDGCELATDGGTNEDSMADNDKITPRQRASAEREYQNRRPEDNPFMEVVDRLRDEEQQSENIYAGIPETTEYGVRVVETGPNGWRRVMRFWTPEPGSREEALEIAAEDHDEVLSSLDDVNTRSVPQPEGWSDE